MNTGNFQNIPGGTPNQAQYAVPQGSPNPVPKNRVPGEARDTVLAVILAILSILITDFIFWSGTGIGVALLAPIMYFATTVYLFRKHRRFGLYSAACAVVFVLLASSLVFSDYSFIKFIAVAAMALLYGANILQLSDIRQYTAGSFSSIADICVAVFALPFDGIGKGMWALFHSGGNDGEEKKVSRKKIGAVLIGAAFAVPVLVVVVPLLASSDAAFEGLLKKISLKWFGEAVGALIVGTVLFILLFSQAFSAKLAEPKKKIKEFDGCVDPVITGSFICIVSVVYLLYLFSQLAYFFNAFSGILKEGYTAAEYARRGFFELCAICVVNLIIIFVSTLLVRKKDGRIPLAQKVLALFICLFSILLAVTAISKMVMYINRFGMTHLRIMTSMFMVFLITVFAAAALRLFIKKLPYMQVALLCGALIIALSCFADIDRVIAAYNTEAYLSGKLESVDMDTMSMLDSDGVVPYLIELSECDDVYVSLRARLKLSETYFPKYFDITENKAAGGTQTIGKKKNGYDFRSFNTQSHKASKLLWENRDLYADPDSLLLDIAPLEIDKGERENPAY